MTAQYFCMTNVLVHVTLCTPDNAHEMLSTNLRSGARVQQPWDAEHHHVYGELIQKKAVHCIEDLVHGTPFHSTKGQPGQQFISATEWSPIKQQHD